MNGECYNFDRNASEAKTGAQRLARRFGMGGSGAPSMNQRAEDPQCPMKRIWCFVGNKNVWANIQPDDDPVNLNFNLDDDTCWAPFLKPGDPEEEEMETEHCIEALKDDDDGAA